MNESLKKDGNADNVVLTVENTSVVFRVSGNLVQATKDVSFKLRRAETLAVVGESGSGKSVTAMAIVGLLPGSASITGSIRFGDQELVGASEKSFRSLRGTKIAVIFQEPMTALNPVYTIGSMLSQALRSHGFEGGKEAIRKRSVELLEMVGMPLPEKQIDQYPHQLSGGLRQRAMIAIAISGEPEILIADEPTTALDVTVQAEILALLRRLQRELGMSMIFITHDMGVVADIADQVCVMRNGHVEEIADVFSVFANPQAEYTRELLAAVPRLGAHAEFEQGDSEASENPILYLENLTVSYPGRLGRPDFTAVHGVSFSVPKGKIIGLVGESGSGKSTIGKAILGLANVADGTIQIDGIDITGLSPKARRQQLNRVSVVFQDPASSLDPRATIGRSLTEPLWRNGIVKGRKKLRQRAGELLEKVRLPASWQDRFPHELSGGQRQRVGIARAISMSPALLIADEPTSALDVSVQAEVLEIFRELQEDLGFSCIFISHDLAVVEELADAVVVLKNGEIVEKGGVAQVLRHPTEEYTQNLIASVPVPDPVAQKKVRL
ncbi:ABC transporter ATP-binding protein [Flaviflexus massiliensis]|uniref:ABC transporter ATP-binding protein n=1 Tax=Flaviflexus massiliensis TaxID=1522309 RepID=UPI0006D58F60|nr:ABC transporter ATP-binding protein [Flaviflexus massiliensis]